MSGGPITLKVFEKVGPLGSAPIVKQAIDVTEFIVDFSHWLNGDEFISTLSNFAIQANLSGSYPSWQTDFPFTQATGALPSDTNPLYMSSVSMLSGATAAKVLLGGGTPLLSYMFSFLATVAPTQRMKEIDVLVNVNQTVNSAMISSITLPSQSVTVVTATTALIAGTSGSVNVQNGTLNEITVTLPPTPVLDQTINAKDVSLNAALYPIVWVGAAGAQIDGQPSFVFQTNGQAAQFVWTGAQWSVR